MIDSGKKTAKFSLNDKHGLRKMARALSSETRLAILETLQSGSRSIGELSEELQIPMSTVSTSVCILEESGLIIAKNKSQERGMLKLCSPCVSQVIFNLNRIGSVETDETPQSLTMNMPIGCYTDAQKITSTCGMCNEYSIKITRFVFFIRIDFSPRESGFIPVFWNIVSPLHLCMILC